MHFVVMWLFRSSKAFYSKCLPHSQCTSFFVSFPQGLGSETVHTSFMNLIELHIGSCTRNCVGPLTSVGTSASSERFESSVLCGCGAVLRETESVERDLTFS